MDPSYDNPASTALEAFLDGTGPVDADWDRMAAVVLPPAPAAAAAPPPALPATGGEARTLPTLPLLRAGMRADPARVRRLELVHRRAPALFQRMHVTCHGFSTGHNDVMALLAPALASMTQMTSLDLSRACS